MASLSCLSNGTKVIQFLDIEGRRRTIRLGKTTKRNAEKFKLRLEALIFARSQGFPPDEETSQWLVKLDRQLLERLSNVDLIAPPGETLLIPFIDQYIQNRKVEVKPNTLDNWNTAREHAKEFFTEHRALREVTVGDAENFKLHLMRKGLAESTARKNCSILKAFFTSAIDHEIILRNPFRKIPSTVEASGDSQMINPATIAKVMDACPDPEMRAIIALARYGGTRIPSEINGLKWEHVLWDENRIILPSPKTERHKGRDKRLVPLFPELRPYLEAIWEPGEVFVCPTYRGRKREMTRLLENAIKLAGLVRWPDLFHNLRKSRQTELEEHFPTHVVCAWLGNTEKVAKKHYLMVTDDHFARALEPRALQNALHEMHDGPSEAPDGQGGCTEHAIRNAGKQAPLTAKASVRARCVDPLVLDERGNSGRDRFSR